MIEKSSVLGATGPLRCIFWGALLLVLDLTIWSGRISFDVLSDFVGALLIAVGIVHLASIEVDPVYERRLRFVLVIAWLQVLASPPITFFSINWPRWMVAAGFLFGIASLVALLLFLFSMNRMCRATGLERSTPSWRLTARLVGVVYVVPLGLIYLASIADVALSGAYSGPTLDLDLNRWFHGGPAACGALIVLLVVAIPFIHLLVSISRTIHELEELRWRTRGRIVGPAVCAQCGYDLTGLPETRCPECGTRFSRE